MNTLQSSHTFTPSLTCSLAQRYLSVESPLPSVQLQWQRCAGFSGDWNIGKARTPPLRAEQRFEYMIIHWQTHAKTHAKTIESSICIGRWTSFKSNIVYITMSDHQKTSCGEGEALPADFLKLSQLWEFERVSVEFLCDFRNATEFSQVSLILGICVDQPHSWKTARHTTSGCVACLAADPQEVSRTQTGSAALPTCWICRSADAGDLGEEIESKGSTRALWTHYNGFTAVLPTSNGFTAVAGLVLSQLLNGPRGKHQRLHICAAHLHIRATCI